MAWTVGVYYALFTILLATASCSNFSSLEAKGDNIETWTGGSFLSAVSSHSGDEMENCVCLVEDVEQTDENFEDVSQIEEEIGDEGGLTLEDVVSLYKH